MSTATAPVFKPLSITDSCLLSLPSLDTAFSYLPIAHKPSKLRLHCSHSLQVPLPLRRKLRSSSLVTLVAQSDWAQQEDENTVATIEQDPESDSQWGAPESESGGEGGFEEREEPSEEAKLFVGNLPYDVDSQKLAMLFEQAGVVEIAEVIYNRDTDQSRGFGFVTMSTVEEAEKAVEILSQYDLNGRLLTVNKAAPKGERLERTPRQFESSSSSRIYVGNLPWDVDSGRLEQLFSEHGKVVNARVVSDRETGRSRGFGFVTMASEAEVNDAIAALDGQSLNGRAIRVNVAEERPARRF